MPAVQELMTPSPTTVSEDATVIDVARIMRDEDTGAVPVVGSDGQPVGLVTDRDIVVRCIAEGADPSSAHASDAQTEELVSVSSSDDAQKAVEKIREHNVRRAVVIDDGALKGIISIGDLAQSLDSESALGDISSAPPNN